MAEPKIKLEGSPETKEAMRKSANISRSYARTIAALAPAPLRDFLLAEPGEPGGES